MTFWSCRKNDFIRKIKITFKIHDATTCLKNKFNTHIAQYSGSKSNQAMKLGL